MTWQEIDQYLKDKCPEASLLLQGKLGWKDLVNGKGWVQTKASMLCDKNNKDAML